MTADALIPPAHDPLRSSLADDAGFAAVLQPYLASVPSKRSELAASLETLETDPAPLREFAHRIKGSAGGYGFGEVTDAAAAVVAACRQNRTADARTAAADLDALLARMT